MNIAGTEIQTPFASEGDDPIVAQCDWAHRVAAVCVEKSIAPAKLPKVIRDSFAYGLIAVQADFIPLKTNASAGYRKLKSHCLADRWSARANGSMARDFIDPLLLGGAPYSIIAMLCSSAGDVTADDIRVYEKLHYNCRGADDVTCMSPIRRRIMSHGGALVVTPSTDANMLARTVAATHGYAALTDMWGIWDVAEIGAYDDRTRSIALRKMMASQLAVRAVAGQMSDEDAVSAINALTSTEKALVDMGTENGQMSGLGLFIEMLNSEPFLPKLAAVKKIDESSRKAVDAKREVDSRIAATAVEDTGIEKYFKKKTSGKRGRK